MWWLAPEQYTFSVIISFPLPKSLAYYDDDVQFLRIHYNVDSSENNNVKKKTIVLMWWRCCAIVNNPSIKIVKREFVMFGYQDLKKPYVLFTRFIIFLFGLLPPTTLPPLIGFLCDRTIIIIIIIKAKTEVRHSVYPQ